MLRVLFVAVVLGFVGSAAFAAPVIFDQPAAVDTGAAPVATPSPRANTPTSGPTTDLKLGSRFTGEVIPNLEVGRYMTAGSIGFTSDSNHGVNLHLNPAIEYFFTDRLSVGGKINASIQSGYNAGGFGPSATYHYWKQDRLDAYAGADILYYRTGRLSSDRHRLYGDSWTNLDVNAGLNYFVTPAVAFGPELTIGHSFGGTAGDFNTQSLLAHFALFL